MFPTEGVFGSLPNLLEMKTQLPNHKRQTRAGEERTFPVLILGLQIGRESEDQLWLLSKCGNVSDLSFQGLVSMKVLLDVPMGKN